jgi:hypothetical protein
LANANVLQEAAATTNTTTTTTTTTTNHPINDGSNSATILIQSWIRRFLVLSVTLPKAIDSINSIRYTAYSIVSELIDAYILEDFIPDILVEVLAGVGKDYDESDTDDETDSVFRRRERNGIYEHILGETLPGLLRETCGLVVQEVLDEYLNAEEDKRSRANKNPIHVLGRTIIDEVVGGELPLVAKEVINEVVREFLLMKQVSSYYDGYIEESVVDKLVFDLCLETLKNENVEDIGKQLMMEVVSEECIAEAGIVLPEMRSNETARMERYAEDLVGNTASGSILMNSVASSLGGIVGHRGETLVMAGLVTSLTKRAMAKRLMFLVNGVENAREFGRSSMEVVFDDVREAMVANMGVEMLIEMLEDEIDLEEALVDQQESG